MIDNADIYQYQKTGTDGTTPGKIYKELAKQYGETGADTIALAARTGDDKAVFDAEAKLKPGYVAPSFATKSKFNFLLIGGGLALVIAIAAILKLRKKKKS